MVLDLSSVYNPEADGGDMACMLAYTYTDIDTDRIETPRVLQANNHDNVILVDKSNVYFSDYTPIDTSRYDASRLYDVTPTGKARAQYLIQALSMTQSPSAPYNDI